MTKFGIMQITDNNLCMLVGRLRLKYVWRFSVVCDKQNFKFIFKYTLKCFKLACVSWKETCK